LAHFGNGLPPPPARTLVAVCLATNSFIDIC
jgi:hypothetical protein